MSLNGFIFQFVTLFTLPIDHHDLALEELLDSRVAVTVDARIGMFKTLTKEDLKSLPALVTLGIETRPRECNIQLTLISKIRHGKVTGISVNSREDEDVDLSPLAQCHDLIRLTVDFPLTQNDLEILSKLPHFAELELLTPCQPDAHSRLEQLNLRRIKLCRPDIELLRTLVKMKRLTSLSLSSLQDVPESLIKEIVGLPSLSDLGIRESVIDDGFMNALKQSRSLRRLWLDGCDLHRSSGIAVLRETDIEFLGLQHVQFPLGSTIAFSDPKYWRRLQRVEISSATAPHVQTRSGITVAEF